MKSFQTLNKENLKAKSSIRSDIQKALHDPLLNSSKTTNFIYKIEGKSLSENEISKVNSLFIKRGDKLSKDIRGRIKAIHSSGAHLTFWKNENSTFQNNLTLIDSALPVILSEILFQFFNSTKSGMLQLVSEVSKSNPIRYDLNTKHPFYSYKIKRLLTDIALGMMPSKVWSGELDSTGGYLIVKKNGEVLCYHIYNRNDFEDYLLQNTKLDTPSSSKHDYGNLYEESGELFFKLNLQIRFRK